LFRSQDRVARLGASDAPVARALGQLLGFRTASGDVDPAAQRRIGDAGTVCMLAMPELVRLQRWPVQVALTGVGRGQTVVDRRTEVGEDAMHDDAAGPGAGSAGPGGVAGAAGRPGWPLVEVALGVDASAMSGLFLETVVGQEF